MNIQCPKCYALIVADLGRYPPWCKKCGVDLKPHEYIPVGPVPAALEEPPAQDEPPVLVSVTSSGPKNWLRGADVVAKPTAPPKPAAPVKPAPAVGKPTAATVGRPKPAEAPAPTPVPAESEQETPLGILSIVGVLLLLIGGSMVGSVWSSSKNYGQATGEVMMTDVKGGGGSVLHTRRIQYVVNGVTYNHDPAGYDLGETVWLLYDVNDPSKVQVGSKAWRYSWAGMITAVGLGVLVAGILRSNRQRQEQERTFLNPSDV